ncbi:MAG TPA: GNAT family N-acetyltransferase [Selenomonadales bacterium]|nr:GNAT family N-acetyltransferase [Selenomonadales bacterium]
MTGPQAEDVQWLWDYCFEKRTDPFFQWYFSRYCREGNVLAGYAGDRMEACLHLNPYDIFLRGATLPVSYIVGLGVAPEARGAAAGELLRGALEEMRRRNHWVSILMPARAGVYYPYQWELCYHQLHYSVATKDLAPVSAKWGTLRRFRQPEDFPALDSVYRRFVAGKHGYARRGDRHWNNLVEEHGLGGGHIYILENAGQAEGYVFYSLDQGKLLVRELAYTGRQALSGLIWFLYQHRSQATVAEWNAPLDDRLHFALPNPKGTVALEPFMAARVVDAAKALEAVGYPAAIDVEIALEIEDNLAPWNNRLLALSVKAGQGRVSPLDARPSQTVRCPVGALTQLIFGRLSASELMAMGRIQPHDAAALALLDQLFPQCTNYINEYY